MYLNGPMLGQCIVHSLIQRLSSVAASEVGRHRFLKGPHSGLPLPPSEWLAPKGHGYPSVGILAATCPLEGLLPGPSLLNRS